MQELTIREATEADADAIRQLILDAFDDSESNDVATLAVELLAQGAEPANLSLVATSGDEILGHVAFSPVNIEGRAAGGAYLLGPLGVAPAAQASGIGSRLVEQGFQALRSRGCELVFVYGDPAYYGRFGFKEEAANNYRAPHPLQYPFGWQALSLSGAAAPQSPVSVGCVPALDDPALW